MTQRPTMTPEAVQSLRTALGLTEKEFAERLGVTVRAVYYWELGQRKPSGTAVRLMERMTNASSRARKQKIDAPPKGESPS